ncbi:CAP domain-containing protein [Emergencia sp. 1XD21-10]|uniref:CAP domain-containing protein n=1 Tax=Emergencia sp. 1XD21-10 TaxID=2304569 RepID=UPI00137A21BA
MIKNKMQMRFIVWMIFAMVLLVQLHATANAAYAEAAPVLETADMTETLTLEAYAKRYQREALKLLNAYRRAHGVKPLSLNKKLQKAADLRATEALQYPQLSHRRYNKKGELRSFSSVYTDLKLRISYRGTGENLAWRAYQTSPEAAAKGMFQQWKKSSAHRKNMLESRYDTVATAIAYDMTGSRGYEYGAASVQLFISSRK